MESSVDEARARIIDLVARVPVEDSVKQVSDAMWQDLNSLSQMPDKSYRYDGRSFIRPERRRMRRRVGGIRSAEAL
ncbi:hypothetical protein PC116_g21102 [Phytophthora cactorum]|uniref:Uncharacterized protein n=1 Tax=Phytophthora cactorum TaxID=29920 RepID=A0A8T1K238_9STRA|nr:hypothetical protein PC113_g17551 [Phytophthora cactorum]KAG4230587.1 hypothetical protein PC116_g21102 [Phytophthora cactorum]